jgi:amino acid transporter
MWTAFASVVSLMLSVSRVPFAAARDGNYFRAFAHLHPQKHFPDLSLLTLTSVTLLFCTLRLQDLIAALVVIRIVVQFLAQTIGVILLRRTRPDLHRPFRIWLYPLPPILATLGFLYVLIERPNAAKEIRYAAVLVIIGTAIYLMRAHHRREWPFQMQGLEARD